MPYVLEEVKTVVPGMVDEFLREIEEEQVKSVVPEIKETINLDGKQLLIKSRVIPAGISRKGESYDAFTVVECFLLGDVKSKGRVFPIYGRNEFGEATEEVIGYKIALRGYLPGVSCGTVKEIITPLFGQTLTVKECMSERTGKNYNAVLDTEGKIVGFADNYYNQGLNYSYRVTVIKK